MLLWRNKMKENGYQILSIFTLLFQAVPPVLLWAISTAVYSEPNRLSESWDRPLSLLILGFSAGISLLLGSISVYGLLSHSYSAVSILFILICCIPTLLAGAVYLHSLLVFLGWV